MKHQYFGDINDYRKYGLLRILAQELRICVCWMLTPDDGRPDGNIRSYLNAKTDPHDPELFQSLKTFAHRRHVAHIEGSTLITGANYFGELVPQDIEARKDYFIRLKSLSAKSDLVFLDPDNGIEVRSCPKDRRNSPKYIYWDELAEICGQGKSLLVYQHFPRVKRDVYVPWLIKEAKQRLSAKTVIMLKAGNVGYLLVLQPKHEKKLKGILRRLDKSWGDEIREFS